MLRPGQHPALAAGHRIISYAKAAPPFAPNTPWQDIHPPGGFANATQVIRRRAGVAAQQAAAHTAQRAVLVVAVIASLHLRRLAARRMRRALLRAAHGEGSAHAPTACGSSRAEFSNGRLQVQATAHGSA
jgi:hypothetical protein